MAERLSLELELLDKVGGPAKKAADALRIVEKQAQKAQSALNFSKELDKTKDQLNKIKLDPKGYTNLLKAQQALREEREKLKKSLNSDHGGFLSSFKHKLKESLGLEGFAGKLAKASFWGHLGAEAVLKIGEGFIEAAHEVVHIISHGLMHAFEAIGKEQERIAGYDLTLGKHGSAETREDIERFAKKTAFSASQNMDMMLPLFRAGLKGQDARTMYAAALDLAAGRGKGSDKGAVSEAVELFARIQQKGGITTKQLAGVGLGEYNIPAFYKDLGKYLHVSAKEAEKKASQPGGVDPAILRNTLVMAIERQQGGQAGTGAERAGGSLFGMWNKLKELPEDFFEKLVNSPAIPKLTKVMGNILTKLDPDGPTGKRIVAGLEAMFTKLAGWIERAVTPENIDKFLNVLSQVPGYLESALHYAELFAAIFIGSKLIGAISSVALGVAGVSAPLLAVGGAVIAIGAAFVRIKETLDALGGWDKFKNDMDFFRKGGWYNKIQEDKANEAFEDATNGPGRKLKGPTEGQRRAEINTTAHVTIVAAPGENPEHTHQRAAVAIGDHISNQAERAAAEH